MEPVENRKIDTFQGGDPRRFVPLAKGLTRGNEWWELVQWLSAARAAKAGEDSRNLPANVDHAVYETRGRFWKGNSTRMWVGFGIGVNCDDAIEECIERVAPLIVEAGLVEIGRAWKAYAHGMQQARETEENPPVLLTEEDEWDRVTAEQIRLGAEGMAAHAHEVAATVREMRALPCHRCKGSGREHCFPFTTGPDGPCHACGGEGLACP